MKNKWVLKRDGTEYSANSLKELRKCVWKGRIVGEDYISNDGGKTWRPAQDVQELIPFFQPGLAKIEEIPRGYTITAPQKEKAIGVIDLAPMIDVIFLLLLFFVVTTTFSLDESVKMNLPSADGTQEEISQQTTLCINADETIYINDRKVAIEEISEELKGIINENPIDILVIKADEIVKHGTVIKVMDTAKKSGVGKIVVAVQKKK